MKKANEMLSVELRFYQGDISPEMLEVLKQVWPRAIERYKPGDDLTLDFELTIGFDPEKALAKMAPFFSLAKGYSIKSSTSIGIRPPLYEIIDVITGLCLEESGGKP